MINKYHLFTIQESLLGNLYKDIRNLVCVLLRRSKLLVYVLLRRSELNPKLKTDDHSRSHWNRSSTHSINQSIQVPPFGAVTQTNPFYIFLC